MIYVYQADQLLKSIKMFIVCCCVLYVYRVVCCVSSLASLTLARILFPQCPEIGVPSRAILVARSQGDASPIMARQTVYAMARMPMREELITVCLVYGDAWRCAPGEIVRTMS